MICTTNCTLTTARIDAKSKFNTIFFKKAIENAEICSIIVVWGITTMNNYEFLEKLGFSSNEAKVYGTLIKHKVLNGYEIAKLSGVARSLVYEVINRLVAKGAVIRIDGEPNFYKPIEYQDLIRSIHNLAGRYGITDEMTKNFLVYNFQKEKTQNGKKR